MPGVLEMGESIKTFTQTVIYISLTNCSVVALAYEPNFGEHKRVAQHAT